jgi:hypothetical protein
MLCNSIRTVFASECIKFGRRRKPLVIVIKKEAGGFNPCHSKSGIFFNQLEKMSLRRAGAKAPAYSNL